MWPWLIQPEAPRTAEAALEEAAAGHLQILPTPRPAGPAIAKPRNSSLTMSPDDSVSPVGA